MPQNEYIQRWQQLNGKRLDHEERTRKRLARDGHKKSADAQNLKGLRAKMMHEARRAEKIQMRKQIKALEQRNIKSNDPKDPSPSNPLPHYLLDRNTPNTAKALASSIKQKRNEKAARFSVPLPKVRGISEEEMFQVVKTGKKTQKKAWKRMIAKPTFVAPGFTRQNPKFERFIRPMGLRQKTAHVSHPTLGITVKLPIIGVKKNPQQPLFTSLGVLTRGTVIEVNVSELGLTTASGKVVWGRYAQITNNPENDGTVNALLLV
ncbi:putative ribosome biogenesis protein nsa2 [Rosellinia necatrix]|uniref:Ribosome biogenesis protein NSA2 homolog n=1 Tax=Rosellinia necatrix TaxID=77044 RepID=A0A1W2TDI8_ROSNE|nr:putative ribosome biogenesis protein nsa2 [Rosellinia necatrix]